MEKRFFGKPGEIKHTFKPNKKGGYWIDTKIGKDGKATKERHYTNHGNSSKHSNPHDNYLSWDKVDGHPIWLGQKNYFEGVVPEFKFYKITGVNINMDYDDNYKTKYEFKNGVKRYDEIVFEWKNKEYEICSLDGKTWIFSVLNSDDNGKQFDNIDDVMNHKIGDDRLIDICTKFTVIERTF